MLRLSDLVEAASPLGPELIRADREVFSAVAHDSRNIEGGELFLAVRTSHGDGHAHLGDAVARGAAGILVEYDLSESDQLRAGAGSPGALSVLRVSDTVGALRLWATRRLRGCRCVVIAGSLGKSTTQHLLVRSWQEASGRAVVGVGDRNDPFGIPIAVGGFPEAVDQVVLEVVAANSRETLQLEQMLTPEVVCVTSATDARELHWESRSGLADSVRGLVKQAHHLVAPISDPDLISEFSGAQLVTFGPLGSGATVEAGPEPRGQEGGWPADWTCLVRFRDREWGQPLAMHPELGAPGLAAANACLVALGLDPRPFGRPSTTLGGLPGRLRVWPGGGGGLVLDDTIDATSSSTELALRALSELPAPRLACLGASADVLLTRRGERWLDSSGPAPLILDGGPPNRGGGTSQKLERVPLSTMAVRARRVLEEGGSVLVKGRSSERMERLTRRLLDGTGELVRQDRGRRLMSFRSLLRPTWVEIDLDALAANVAEVASELGSVQLMAVVKADAYGHGAVQVGRTALTSGARWLATATLAEASELREAGIAAPILVLGYTPPDRLRQALALNLVLTVFDREVLAGLDAAAEALALRARAHLKVDTGMSRLGIAPSEVGPFLQLLRQFPSVEVEGIYTHFRKGEDEEAVTQQLIEFRRALGEARTVGHRFRLRHAASSSSWASRPEARFDMVRCGGELLGLRTADGRHRRPVLAFKTTVAQVRHISAGTHVGYGDSFTAPQDMTVATLPVGYGDGFRRGPNNFGEVIIGGQPRRLIGDVSMDMCMVDVSSPPLVSRGDQVVLIGAQGSARISVEDVAARLGTINYEVVTQILARVPREAVAGDAAEL